MTAIICALDLEGFYANESRTIEDYEGCPFSWVFAEPPSLAPGECARFVHQDASWEILTERPLTPEPVPFRISKLQAEMQLYFMGELDSVTTLINSGNPGIGIYWRAASHIHRNHPMIEIIQVLKEWTNAQIDQMFIDASKLS